MSGHSRCTVNSYRINKWMKVPDVPLGVERKDGAITVKMILLLPSFWKRTTIGLVANCYEKNEKTKGFWCGQQDSTGRLWGRENAETQLWDHCVVIFFLPSLVGSGFPFLRGVCLPFCRDDRENTGWSGGAGTQGISRSGILEPESPGYLLR